MTALPQLILATRNAHKTAEIREMLGGIFDVCDVTAFPQCPEIEETGTTFHENARLKAEGISAVMEGWVLSDDSGLEVDALGGAPGVWSSSYGGEEGNHEKNNVRLKEAMSGEMDRRARFRCTMVLALAGREVAYFSGTWRAFCWMVAGARADLGMIRCLCRRGMGKHLRSWVGRSKTS